MASPNESWIDSMLNKLAAQSGRVTRKEWLPEDVRHRPIVKQIIKNAFPKLSTGQLSTMIEFAGPHMGPTLTARRGDNPSQAEVIQVVRDMAQNPRVKELLDGYKASYENEQGIPLERQGEGQNEFENNKPRQKTFNAAQLKLRSRYIQPGSETLTETTPEAVSDIVQSDLFSYNTANAENGVNNSVYIETELNEMGNMVNANIPRPPDRLEQLVGLSKIPWQWNDTIDVQEQIEDIMKDTVVEVGMQLLPPVSITLKDIMPISDPFRLPRVKNSYVPVNNLQPGFQKDYTQGTSFGQLDAVGFKREGYDTWRFPREPSQFLPGTRPVDEATSAKMQDEDGIMVPMQYGMVGELQYDGGTVLNGEGFLPSSLFV